jgi:hypothetical protein
MISTKHVVCVHDDCINRAYYGKPGNKILYCLEHRLPGMIHTPNKKCNVSKCKNIAIYGLNCIPTRCEEHKQEDDQNMVEQSCKNCNLTMITDSNGLCEYCNPSSFQAIRLAKQTALMNYLNSRELYGTSTDIIVNDGVCGKERPDRVFEMEDKIVIVECDEHQHRERNCACEQTRMINIGQGYGGLPVYFIRWNPDDYSTCGDNKPEYISKRYKLLADYIFDIKNGNIILPPGLVSVMYMYYNGWDGLLKEEWKILLNYESL